MNPDINYANRLSKYLMYFKFKSSAHLKINIYKKLDSVINF